MITKFNNFLNETFWISGKAFYKTLISDLTYDEATTLAERTERIGNYIFDKYPNEIKGDLRPAQICRSETSIKKYLRFARKNNDNILIDLIQSYINEIEELKLKKDAEKYNL